MLRDIEDGTMIVLRTLTFHSFNVGIQHPWVISGIMRRWESRMHPEYEDYERYEGVSRYLTPLDVIRSSKKLRKQRKRCKYKTISEMVAMVERDHILAGTKYDIDYIELDISVSHRTQRLDDDYFHRK